MSKQNYKYIWGTPETVEFKVSEEISPYMEMNEYIINQDMNKKILEVNPYLRFFDIFYHFNEICINKDKLNEECLLFKNDFENKTLLYLRKLDFINGTTILDIYCEKLISEIEKGIYGENLKKYIEEVSIKDREIIALGIIKRIFYEYEEFKILKIIINNFFKDNIIYRNLDNENEIILYLNYKRDKQNVYRVKIIKEVFLPLGFELKTYWSHHFGIINLDEVFKIEKMGVF